MKRIFILLIMCLFMTSADAQLLKKLKAKVDRSSKDVKTRVKEKAETAPERVIDHAANKVETKAETKIDNKENKANAQVDKTVDKVDSIKIKKSPVKETKDSIPGSARIDFPHEAKNKIGKNQLTGTRFYNAGNTTLLLYDRKRIFI